MKKFVVMSGGFHPFHAGHASLYQQAKEAFPDATVLVCATNVQTDRPFPFTLKKELAQLSGVPPKDFIEVSRQFNEKDPALANRIGDPNKVVVIYVRSDKDRNDFPIPWKLNPDGSVPMTKGSKNHPPRPTSNYLLAYPGEGRPLEPVSKHAYMAYLKTVEFGPGITSASEIRKAWPTLNDKRKTAMVMSLYPATQKNPKLAQNVVGMFDQVMGVSQGVAEGSVQTFAGKDPMTIKSPKGGTPTMMIVTGQGSRYLITNDGMVLRNKSFHANTGGADQGLKDWADAIEFYDPKELPGGATFPMSVAKAVEKRLTVTLSKTKDGKRALLIHDGSQWRVAKISDVYKHVATTDDPIVATYSITPKLNWNVLDYTMGTNKALKSVHPGSPVTHGIRLGQQQGVTEEVDEGAEEALQYATQAHAGQTRSGGESYITHPMRVADHIKQYKQSHNLDALISAAYLHDTVEDTDTTHEALHDLFGGLVASLVQELTSDPEQIKKVGKAQYLAHKMAAMSSYALVIKLADRLDNVKDITTARTPQWRQKYKNETEHILNYIEKTRALSGTHQKLIGLIRDKLSELDNQPKNDSNLAESLDYLEEK